jgi:hypothetical protein
VLFTARLSLIRVLECSCCCSLRCAVVLEAARDSDFPLPFSPPRVSYYGQQYGYYAACVAGTEYLEFLSYGVLLTVSVYKNVLFFLFLFTTRSTEKKMK